MIFHKCVDLTIFTLEEKENIKNKDTLSTAAGKYSVMSKGHVTTRNSVEYGGGGGGSWARKTGKSMIAYGPIFTLTCNIGI